MKSTYTVLVTSSFYSHQYLQERLMELNNNKFFPMTNKVNAWYMYYIDKTTISMKFNLKPYGDQYIILFYIKGKEDLPIINSTDLELVYSQLYDINKVIEKVIEKIEEEELNKIIKSLNYTISDMSTLQTIPQNDTIAETMKHFKYEDYAKTYFDTDMVFTDWATKTNVFTIPPRNFGKTKTLFKNFKDLDKCTKSIGENMIQKIQVNEKKKIVTVVFDDDDVKMIKCSDKDEFDPSIGVALCIAAHVFNSKTKFKKFVNTQIEKQNKKKKCTNSSKLEKTE